MAIYIKSKFAKGGRTPDCAVVALAEITHGYAAAREAFEAIGYTDKDGFRWASPGRIDYAYRNAALENHIPLAYKKQFRTVFRKWPEHMSSVTADFFAKHHKAGRYYCVVPGHAFAVIDGVIVDNIGAPIFDHIVAAWQYIEGGRR